ncbi:hypothetical protein BJY00DRAFT_289734 [Aspergillus carlsbadensis]|nr:hypothetical protein BJY00DRAFT_289734 [Aspergillus carlsbadensis]
MNIMENVDLFAFALNAGSILCGTIQNIQPHTKSVASLLLQLQALIEVISDLDEAAQSHTDLHLSNLHTPIYYCGTTCEQFDNEVRQQLRQSDNKSGRLRSWVRLNCMGCSVDEFKELLSVCYSIVSISLVDMQLRRKLFVTAEDLSAHRVSIKAAEVDIETQLEVLGVKIESTSESQYLSDQQLYLHHCLRVCIQLFENMREIEGKRKVRQESTYSHDLPERNISIISNYSLGNSVQFMASCDRTIIRGSNRSLGPNTKQAGGHFNDTSLQKLSRDWASIDARCHDNEASRVQSDVSSPASSSGSRSVFKRPHGLDLVPSFLPAIEASATSSTTAASMYCNQQES